MSKKAMVRLYGGDMKVAMQLADASGVSLDDFVSEMYRRGVRAFIIELQRSMTNVSVDDTSGDNASTPGREDGSSNSEAGPAGG